VRHHPIADAGLDVGLKCTEFIAAIRALRGQPGREKYRQQFTLEGNMNVETRLWMHGEAAPLPEFTAIEADQAAAEGWCLSERDDGMFEIQRDDEAETFAGDFSAYVFVRRLAEQGSYAHRLAIQWHGMPAP
jgi:hypothetical protein